MFLYQQIEQAKVFGAYKELPEEIRDGLSPRLPLRPYQEEAFGNFITYFENGKLRKNPSQVLFHMATGSGKTLIMAGLILYLYSQGYRDFLFFVNLSTIVRQTEAVFLNAASPKYLFAEEILLEGRQVKLRKAANLQDRDPDAVNLFFTTTQGLHSGIWNAKENALSFADFRDRPVVLISDEAHHLNVSTKKKLSREEEENYHSWEETVQGVFHAHPGNVLLEFTATCDLKNPQIFEAYEDKIVFDYPLRKFREDLYSKEIVTLRSDLSPMDRALQALMLSQYRLKVFQQHRLPGKPVVLLKSAKIAESRSFQEEFQNTIRSLSGETLERISTAVSNPTMQRAYAYFAEKGISFEALALELREDFSPEHCVSANDDKDVEGRQLSLNSLEEPDNPYRAVFEVKKLDEGWDVLNLFDIVRLYETRQSGGGRISESTVSEAQLIGRGARYCPFRENPEQPLYQRKYDHDLSKDLRICEELYYHCQNDSRYIGELHNALREIGVDPERLKTCTYRLKESFRTSAFYQTGLVFVNRQVSLGRCQEEGLPERLRQRVYSVRLALGGSGEDLVMEDDKMSRADSGVETYVLHTTFGELAAKNYAIVHKALMKYAPFRFSALKKIFPALSSTREFITGGLYLGQTRLEIASRYDAPPPLVLHEAAALALGEIADTLDQLEEKFEGSREFSPLRISDVFTEKEVCFTDPKDGGAGVSQWDGSVPEEWRLDLSKEDWFAFEDNFGTPEEKAFVAAFKGFVPQLRKRYDQVWLVRNERFLHLYSFEEGQRFEPDYLLFLQRETAEGREQLQIFLEPKGNIYLEPNGWKERFLLQLEEQALPVKIYVDDKDYRIRGFHFFNREHRQKEFAEDMKKILSGP